jgi:hypothetical protein
MRRVDVIDIQEKHTCHRSRTAATADHDHRVPDPDFNVIMAGTHIDPVGFGGTEHKSGKPNKPVDIVRCKIRCDGVKTIAQWHDSPPRLVAISGRQRRVARMIDSSSAAAARQIRIE